MFIQIDKGIYEKLSEAEKGVIQFLNQNEEKIPYMSITNIAAVSYTHLDVYKRQDTTRRKAGIPYKTSAIQKEGTKFIKRTPRRLPFSSSLSA